jgi:hypothetical protein
MIKLLNKIFLIHIIIVVLFPFCEIKSQNLVKKIEKDTVLVGIYTGKVKYNIDEKNLRQGKFEFNSDLIQVIEENSISFKELFVNGEFLNEKKIGLWTYKSNNYHVNNNGLRKSWDIRFNHQIDGFENKYLLNFDQGMPSGKWEIKTKTIVKGQYKSEKSVAVMNFKDSYLTGDFSSDFETTEYGTIKLKGKTNADGFLDGKLTLEYIYDGKNIKETRNYENGFLTNVEKINTKTNETIDSRVYEDVVKKLDLIKKNGTNYNFKISDKSFGIEFNNGYKTSSKRLTIQEKGNEVLSYFFTVFNEYIIISDSTQKPNLKLTRRFQFVYPSTDDSLADILKPKIESLHSKLKNYLESPKYILRKESSDSLAFAYAYVNHAIKKVETARNVLDKIELDYFDFLNRNNYYANGVDGLNKRDTVKYTLNNNQKTVLYDVEKTVNNPNDLLENIDKYINEVSTKTSKWIEISNNKIQFYEEQDRIDSLDARIVAYKYKIDSSYVKYEIKDPKEIPLFYKIYKSTNERLIKDLEQNYIYIEEYNEKVKNGIELSCLLEFLHKNYQRFIEIENLPKYWNDSIFTDYQNNPFDNRLFESKKIGNVQKGGTKLLKYYVLEILKANNCEKMETKMKNIELLEIKILDLAKRFEEEEVKMLNRAMRRENVPARIERVLDL